MERPNEQQKDYGDYLDLEASTINRLIDTLISKGLIEKSGSGRGSSVSLTDDGKALYLQITQTMNHLKKLMEDSLSHARFNSLVQDLTVARRALHS